MYYFEAFHIISSLLMFVSVIGLVVAVVLRQWIRDKNSPRIITRATVQDKVIGKQRIHRRKTAAPGMTTGIAIIYYVTFQLEDGECLKLRVSKSKYSELQKGSSGKLTFQGQKYISFEVTKGTGRH